MFDLDALLAGIGDGASAPASTEVIGAGAYAAMLAMLDAPVALSADDVEDTEPRERDAKREGTKATRRRARQKANRLEHIVTLDMETDPFDAENGTSVSPFMACLYSDQFEPVIVWNDNREAFVDDLMTALEAIPFAATIYAHNGGKFDYMFLMHKLRGDIMFKGRGLMKAKLGRHELRDSMHIVPGALAQYKKDDFDYSILTRARRNEPENREKIIRYCINDCKYLFDLVKAFNTEFHFPLSIGQAAMAEIRRHYKFERITEAQDEYLRQWFYGGRVECGQGMVRVTGDWKQYDVNSMYPAVMANCEHPIGNVYFVRSGNPTPDTVFIDLTCWNDGALITRNENGTNAPIGRHRFKTTIHEYNMALKLGLIRDIELHACVDFPKRTKFDKFVLPHYERRQELKRVMYDLRAAGQEETDEYDDLVKKDLFSKLLLNNGYGKFAQNPRKYKDNCYTEIGEAPEDGADAWGGAPKYMVTDKGFWVWERASGDDLRFNNVATGASITGAARAELMQAIFYATDPIYCDTDCVIARDVSNIEIDKAKLGAWSLDKSMSEVIICGKKLYAYTELTGKTGTRAKGASALTYKDMISIYEGETIINRQRGETLTPHGSNGYLERRISATAPIMDDSNGKSALWRGAGAGQSPVPISQ